MKPKRSITKVGEFYEVFNGADKITEFASESEYKTLRALTQLNTKGKLHHNTAKVK